MSGNFFSAVIVAAGNSSRMGGKESKIFIDLCGKAVILRTAEIFAPMDAVQEIVVVTRPDLCERVRTMLRGAGIQKLTAVVEGGAMRLESVQKGILACSGRAKLIAVHDGARPLASRALVLEAIRAADKWSAAIPAVQVRDTIRLVEHDVGVQTPDRTALLAMQTPQVFDADLLRAAIQNAMQRQLPVTDDGAAVEAMGGSVRITRGDEENFKITTQMDLELARLLVKKRNLP